MGRYPATLLEGLSAERRSRFFESLQRTFVVAKEIRDLCTFSTHSFVRDPPSVRRANRRRKPRGIAPRIVLETRGLLGSVKPTAEIVGQLPTALIDTRERLQSLEEEHQTALEELRSSSEELHSVNEALQPTNEDLETSKEPRSISA